MNEKGINLQEAFQALEIINEDVFNITPEGAQKLDTILNSADDDNELSIIDLNAEYDDELQDSYIGDVILKCPVCESMIYKNPEEVVLSEEETTEGEKLVNIGDTCPYCQTSDGYVIIGQVEEYCPNCDKNTDEVKVEIEDKEELDESKKNKKIMFGKNRCYEELKLYTTLDDYEPWSGAVDTWNKIQEKGLEGQLESILEDIYPDGLTMTEFNDIIWFERDWLEDILNTKFDDEDKEELDESLEQSKPLREDIENVTVETKDQIINVSAEEKGKDTEAVSAEEVLRELEPETEDKFKEVDVDEFDEESFDDLNERYLKNIYENVKSYKTTGVKQKGNNKLFIEGLIDFKSGKKAKTNYVFEAHSISKELKFYGMNEQFARGSKAFALRGALKGNKFICESLTCKYTAKDGRTGETKPVYKTINK